MYNNNFIAKCVKKTNVNKYSEYVDKS